MRRGRLSRRGVSDGACADAKFDWSSASQYASERAFVARHLVMGGDAAIHHTAQSRVSSDGRISSPHRRPPPSRGPSKPSPGAMATDTIDAGTAPPPRPARSVTGSAPFGGWQVGV